MLPDGGLIFAGQKLEAIGDVPLLYGVADVGEEPANQRHHQDGRHNLHGPLDYPDVPPEGYALVG